MIHHVLQTYKLVLVIKCCYIEIVSLTKTSQSKAYTNTKNHKRITAGNGFKYLLQDTPKYAGFP